MYLCCLLPLHDILRTVMARYSLFVLKVPLNRKKTNKQKLLLGCGEDTTSCCIDASCDMTSVRYVVAIRPRSGSRWEHSTLVMSGLCRRFLWKTRRCLANTCEWTCCHTSAVNISVHSPYSGHSLQHCYVTAESNSHHGDIAFVSDRP